MIRTLGHRGPDGFSVMALPGAVLAHARLAIIDLVTGVQPIGNEDGTVQVVLNGEIYNYRELRAELEGRGHRFRTQSDTEVIPHLYEEMGEEFVSRLRGMFAIALARRAARKLVCSRATGSARSRSTGRGPPRASTSRASRARSSGAKASTGSIDHEALAHYLTWQYVPAPWSIYRGIRKLPAATMLVADARGERLTRYWDDAPSPLPPLDSDEALAKLEGPARRGVPDPACGATSRSERSSREGSTPGSSRRCRSRRSAGRCAP